MQTLKNILIAAVATSFLTLTACAKEPASNVVTTDVVITQATASSESVDVKIIEKKVAEIVQTPVSVEPSIKELDTSKAEPRLIALNTDIKTLDVAVPSTTATTSVKEEAKSEWVKVESNESLGITKPSGNHAIPVADELDSAEEFLGLDKYKGKVVYLDFWASWCGPCRETFPFMNKMQEKYPDDLVVVAVNLDEDKANAEKFLEKYPANFEIVYDQLWQAGREYGIYGLPFSFIYNRQGELVGKHGGFKPGDEINLDAALKNLMDLGE